MFAAVLSIFLGFVIAAVVRMMPEAVRDPRLFVVALGGYLLRLLGSAVIPTLNIFSYGSGSDGILYDAHARTIAKLWSITGVHYVSAAEFPDLGDTSFPQNVFGLVHYLNGEPTHFGCTAVVAAVSCLACVKMYAIAMEIGARRDVALTISAMAVLTPSFFCLTADMCKDGFVVFFEFGVLGAALRLSKKVSVAQLLFAILCILGLWGTRFYLVYVMTVPLFFGTAGVRSRSTSRVTLTSLAYAAALVACAVYSRGAEAIVEHATTTFEGATASYVVADNATGGSGVALDTSSPFADFLPKLIYTLFSPFPWQSGSVALHLAKFETLAWYYLLFRAIRHFRELWRTEKVNILLLLCFIGPVFFMYTTTFSNIGVVVRERLGAVMAVAVLASASWKSRAAEAAPDERGLVGVSG